MVKIEKLVYGLYPRSERLRIKIGRWERKRDTFDSLLEEISREKKEHYALNIERNRIDHFTDPLSNWNDIYRPIVLASDGMTLGPLRRYRETNTFYRLPEIRGKLKLKEDLPIDLPLDGTMELPMYQDPGLGDYFAFLPSPISFNRMSDHGSYETDEIIDGIVGIYNSILEKLGLDRILLYEATGYQEGDTLSSIENLLQGRKVILVSTGAISESVFRGLRYEFQSVVVPDPSSFGLSASHSRVAGVGLSNAFSTSLSSEEKAADTAIRLSERHGVSRCIVTHNDYMDFLPRGIADRKLMALSGEA